MDDVDDDSGICPSGGIEECSEAIEFDFGQFELDEEDRLRRLRGCISTARSAWASLQSGIRLIKLLTI